MASTAVKRERLTRERILASAVQHADAFGLASVTIRSLAGDLGAHPMSLYHYFDSKDAILEAMIEVLLAEHPLPPVESWQEWATCFFTSMRSLAQAHPGAFEVVQTSPATGRHAGDYSEQGLRCFLDAGFAAPDAVAAVRSVGLAALGLSANERARALRTPAELTGSDEVDLWAFTLNVLITGLTPTRRTRRKQEKT